MARRAAPAAPLPTGDGWATVGNSKQEKRAAKVKAAAEAAKAEAAHAAAAEAAQALEEQARQGEGAAGEAKMPALPEIIVAVDPKKIGNI